jgi:hypothetical protein
MQRSQYYLVQNMQNSGKNKAGHHFQWVSDVTQGAELCSSFKAYQSRPKVSASMMALL